MENNQSRRKFLQSAALVAGSIPLLSRILNNPAYAQATPILDMANPTAVALGYNHDATKVDPIKFPKRASADGAKEFCHNCMFFSGGGQKVEGQEGDWGKCTIFTQGLVNANGWCNTWSLKPGATL